MCLEGSKLLDNQQFDSEISVDGSHSRNQLSQQEPGLCYQIHCQLGLRKTENMGHKAGG